MYEALLADLGLTKSEIAVYFALLKLGSSTTGPIIKEAGIAAGKAYLILDKLRTKGLVTVAIVARTKQYQAADPERLLDYLREKEESLKRKEEELQRLIPVIKQEYAHHTPPRVELFEGEGGFKTFYELILRMLTKGETICILGVPRETNERFEGYLLDWNKRRIARGIRMRILYNHDCKRFGKLREQMPLTEVCYMKREFETPAWIDIFQDYVVTINVHRTPVCFLIKSPESAMSYRQYFDYLWENMRDE